MLELECLQTQTGDVKDGRKQRVMDLEAPRRQFCKVAATSRGQNVWDSVLVLLINCVCLDVI